MNKELLYVESKQGHSGSAWIGHGQFSKSWSTVYFDGKILKKSQGINSNHFDLETGEEYWISGVKRNGADRHWAGSGKVQIDRLVVEEYLTWIGQPVLSEAKFILVDLNNVPNTERSLQIENSPKVDSFDENLLYKKLSDLNDEELKKLIQYYSELDLTVYPLKARKGYREKINELEAEQQSRNV